MPDLCYFPTAENCLGMKNSGFLVHVCFDFDLAVAVAVREWVLLVPVHLVSQRQRSVDDGNAAFHQESYTAKLVGTCRDSLGSLHTEGVYVARLLPCQPEEVAVPSQ